MSVCHLSSFSFPRKPKEISFYLFIYTHTQTASAEIASCAVKVDEIESYVVECSFPSFDEKKCLRAKGAGRDGRDHKSLMKPKWKC
jgi:hypothetical protein